MTEQEMFELFAKSGLNFGTIIDVENDLHSCQRRFKALEDGFDYEFKLPTLIYSPEFSQMVDRLCDIEKKLDALNEILNEEDSSDTVIENYFKLIELDLKDVEQMIAQYYFDKKIVRIKNRRKIKFQNKGER